MASVIQPATAPAPASSGPRELTPAECRALLREVGWGILSTVGGGRPYGVPVGYALGAECVYVASGSGRKRANLEAHPIACLTVCDVETYASWRSVVVEAEVEEVTGALARAAAVAAFTSQRSPRAATTGADVKRLLTARIFRLSLAGVTGRTREP